MITARGFRSGAILALLIIFGAAVLHWPIPSLGFSADLTTGVVLTVAPGSAAEQGGLRPGDRITYIYGYPWEALNTRLHVMPLPWRDGTPTMMSISSAGASHNLTLRADLPDRSLQIEKALRLLVALVC